MSTENPQSDLKPQAQEHAWQKLLQWTPRLPQALLFLGPEGVGKQRTAMAFYQWMHCQAETSQHPCGQCSPCQKIAKNQHLDLIVIDTEAEQIPVEVLRQMQTQLFFAPYEGKLRFVIINDAHKLSGLGANTLLKTIEEPPAHTRFILITHDRSLLLPTILSRCQILQFEPLPQNLRDQILQKKLQEQKLTLSAPLQSVYGELLGPGLNRVERLATEECVVFLENVLRNLSRPDDLATLLTTDEPWKLELFLGTLMVLGSQRLHNKVAQNNLSAAWYTANSILETNHLRRRLERHANKKLIALHATLQAERVLSEVVRD